jgi:hypothetical protein
MWNDVQLKTFTDMLYEAFPDEYIETSAFPSPNDLYAFIVNGRVGEKYFAFQLLDLEGPHEDIFVLAARRVIMKVKEYNG